eukprot:s141_g34.t2
MLLYGQHLCYARHSFGMIASDTCLGDRFYGGPNRMGSEERLPERAKSLTPSGRSTGSPMGERRIGKATAAMRSLSVQRNSIDLEATVKPGDGQEGDSLRQITSRCFGHIVYFDSYGACKPGSDWAFFAAARSPLDAVQMNAMMNPVGAAGSRPGGQRIA